MIQAMFQAVHNARFEAMERAPGHTAAGSAGFADLFGEAAKPATTAAGQPAVSANSVASPAVTVGSATGTKLGDPDVQGWLTSYYTELAAANPGESASSANIPYQPATGAATNYPAGSVYGPDQIYTQALYNQNDYEFANLTGHNPADSMSQLPGMATTQAQQEYDSLLANVNAQRLASGQPIDTAAYWSDPGPVNYMGHTYTSQELGYCGPGQSSGPEPIFISQGDQLTGTNNFCVPGYSGTVTGIQANRYYTLQQLEQAGLKTGQPDAQFHPGSWTLTTAGAPTKTT